MRLEKCWFCSSTIYPGHGIQFVRNDAKVFRFCRSKCHKNFKMKRNPRKVKWTKAYRRLHAKELTEDSTFEFERRRNRPERYNRSVVEDTVKALTKIDEIRQRRQDRFYENRMKGKKALEKKAAIKELQEGIHLVKAPVALAADSRLTLPEEAGAVKEEAGRVVEKLAKVREKVKVRVQRAREQQEQSMDM